MKKSTLIGLSILSVFLLCSLSYQPMLAEDKIEFHHSQKPISFIYAKGNFTIENENINGIIEIGILFFEFELGWTIAPIRNEKLRNFPLSYFYEGLILPIVNKKLVIGFLNNTGNISPSQPDLRIAFMGAKGNFTYDDDNIYGIADTLIVWSPMFYGWLPIKIYNFNFDGWNKFFFKRGLILPIFTRQLIIGFIDVDGNSKELLNI